MSNVPEKPAPQRVVLLPDRFKPLNLSMKDFEEMEKSCNTLRGISRMEKAFSLLRECVKDFKTDPGDEVKALMVQRITHFLDGHH